MSKSLIAISWAMGIALAAALIVAATALPAKADPPAQGGNSKMAPASPATNALQAAAKKNKYFFIFFWSDDTEQSRLMRGVFHAAMEKLTAKADAVEVQLGDAGEKEIVARYDVSRSPMPLVLAIAPNGAITKGLATNFDETQLQDAFVSPCTAECMKALQQRKLVLLCIEPASSQVKQVSLQAGVKDFAADKEYADAIKVVVLRAGDSAETAFLKDLQVDPRTTARVTVLMAPPGAVIGTFPGDVSKEELVAKLKSAQSGCCPGGKCGPGGCCGKK
jgi:hypothetical protein